MVDPGQDSPSFEKYRGYLTVLARSSLSPAVGKRISAQDLVQQTLFEAHEARDRYESRSPAEEAGWLRKILAHNLASAGRDHRREKRDVGRERSLQDDLARSSMNLQNLLAAGDPSPSHQAMADERTLRLAEAIAELPDDQAEVLLLQHWHGWSLRRIAEHRDITKFAVTRLLRQAISALQSDLKDFS